MANETAHQEVKVEETDYRAGMTLRTPT